LAESPEAEAEPDALASPPALPEGALLAEPLELALELELPLADALDPEFEVALAHAENTTARAGTPSESAVRRLSIDVMRVPLP